MRYTLVSDGSSDRTLVHILNWAIRDVGFIGAIEPSWADLSRVPRLRRLDLASRVRTSIELYPCDILFVHRDAEGDPRETRVLEIANAVPDNGCAVPVVPVRMTEAWLLHDELAIRNAAGNPNDNADLALPPVDRAEQLPDPKHVLYEALRNACGLNALRKAKLDVAPRVHRVAELIADFSPLRRLTAFAALQNDLRRVVHVLRDV